MGVPVCGECTGKGVSPSLGTFVPLGNEPHLHEGFGVGLWGGEPIWMPEAVILRGRGVVHMVMGGINLIQKIFPGLGVEVKFSKGIYTGIIK